MTREEIVDLIVNTLEDICGKVACGPSVSGSLFGSGGVLDSVGLLHLVVNLEERLAPLVGKPVRLVSSDTMSQGKSPFRTVDSLADYVVGLCQ